MRILIVADARWDPRLGVGRELIEYERLWTRLGHEVEHYSLDEAFPTPPRYPRLIGLVGRDFARAAGRHVRRNAHRFDVIDALQGCLPQNKQKLRFKGLLVMRSCGLRQHYHPFRKEAGQRWPDTRGKRVTRPFRARQWRIEARRAKAHIDHADLLNVLTPEERDTCASLGAADRTVWLPHGLEESRFELFSEPNMASASVRNTVAFVGSWHVRKGSRDLPEIWREITRHVPDARLIALGTGASQERLRAELDSDRVDVVPSFEPRELPGLLRRASVGIFPSYVEGFPVAFLEMMAAGVPVVSYDIAGPRIMELEADPSLLVPVGDALAIARRVLAEIREREPERVRRSRAVRKAAERFRQEDIAEQTVRIYADRLARLRPPTPSAPG